MPVPARYTPRLTPRHLDALACKARGMTNSQAARALGVSVHTLNHHVVNARKVLGARTRTEAVVEALRRGELTFSKIDAADRPGGD